MQLHLLTGSSFKISTARLALEPHGIEVVPVSVHIPEIQADTNMEIARAAALEAAKMLNTPVAREDHGFFLDAIPGFPGPYMAYIEKTVQPEIILTLLHGKVHTGEFRMALAYATPDGEVMEFSERVRASVATEVRTGPKDFGWDRIICLGDETRTISEYPAQERLQYFTGAYEQLAQKLLQSL